MIAIGNRVGRKKGFSWSSYWTSIISAVVNNANPKNLLLTFPSPKTIQAADLAVSGNTVESLSWTGNVCTVVLGTAILYGQTPTVNFKSLGARAITNNVTYGIYFGDELFYLDGNIIADGGNDYFEDITGNDRHFLITSKDFSSSWTKGFPYKSAAIISAPAGDAALIAADINNFLYAGDGTPNQIPIISLFSNIDYQNRIFCKHEAQVLDGNNVETYEPRVTEIFMSSAALSDSDLTKALTYFSAESYSTNDKCFAPHGDDTTGDGTPNTPYLTLAKAMLTATTNAIAMTGTYNMGAAQTTLTKGFKGVGFVKFTNYASYGFNQNYKAITGIWFAGSATYPIYSEGGTILKCKSTGNTRYFVLCNSGTNLIVRNCIIGASGTTYRTVTCKCTTPTIDGNLFVDTNQTSIDLTNASSNATITHNKFKGTVTNTIYLGSNFSAITLTDNAIVNQNVINDTSNRNGNITATYNSFSSTANHLFIKNTGGTGTVIITDNIITSNNAIVIYITEKSLQVKRNISNLNGAGATFVSHESATASVTLDISNNRHTNTLGGTSIIIGNEGSAIENKITGSVYNNFIQGNSANHGIFLWGHSSFSIKHNYIKNCDLPIVLKGNNFDYTNVKVYANICDNGRIVIKGVDNANIIGNTVMIPNTNDSPCVYSLSNGAGFESNNNIFKNNIFFNQNVSSGAGYSVIYAAASSESFLSDYNLLFSNGYLLGKIGATEYADMATWQAAGYDVSGLNTNPNLSSSGLPSAGIDGGENLGADYQDGLDESTAWGDISTVPTVVTKNQGITWQMGAYIK